MRSTSTALLLLLAVLMAPAVCSAHLFTRHARRYVQVFVKTPYLELHTGPGRGYPIFDVVRARRQRHRALPPHAMAQGPHAPGRRGMGVGG